MHQHFLPLVRSGKDADPDIPILKEAKAEYAKLQYQEQTLLSGGERINDSHTLRRFNEAPHAVLKTGLFGTLRRDVFGRCKRMA
jgi:hypothetical protein